MFLSAAAFSTRKAGVSEQPTQGMCSQEEVYTLIPCIDQGLWEGVTTVFADILFSKQSNTQAAAVVLHEGYQKPIACTGSTRGRGYACAAS